MPRFELFYSTGGHGGPYPSYESAVDQAKRLLEGNHTEMYIDVYEYTKDKTVDPLHPWPGFRYAKRISRAIPNWIINNEEKMFVRDSEDSSYGDYAKYSRVGKHSSFSTRINGKEKSVFDEEAEKAYLDFILDSKNEIWKITASLIEEKARTLKNAEGEPGKCLS